MPKPAGTGPRGPELPFVAVLGGVGCGASLAVAVLTMLVALSARDTELLLPLGTASVGFGVSLAGVFLRRHPWLYALSYLATLAWLPILIVTQLVQSSFLGNWIIPFVYGPSFLGSPLMRASFRAWWRVTW